MAVTMPSSRPRIGALIGLAVAALAAGLVVRRVTRREDEVQLEEA
jgi:hypothetical protein